MNLAAMTPQGELASTKYCLANAGTEYLVYQPKPGEGFSVELKPGHIGTNGPIRRKGRSLDPIESNPRVERSNSKRRLGQTQCFGSSERACPSDPQSFRQV